MAQGGPLGDGPGHPRRRRGEHGRAPRRRARRVRNGGRGEDLEGFAAGTLEADDEVAIAHGTEEDGFRGLSEALVNMRATLGVAVADQVCEQVLADR